MHTKKIRGFTMLELMVSLAVLTVICGAIFSALFAYQKTYASEMLKSDMRQGVEGAAESIAQEIGQAGAVPQTTTTLTGAVAPSVLAQGVSVGSTAKMFVGETLQVDGGANYETVTITNVLNATTITAVFNLNHAAGSVVWASGVIPQGILSSSAGNVLQLVGDINGDGTLVYEEYICDTNAGTLTRSVTPVGASEKNPAIVVVQGIVANPDATPCFTYAAPVSAGGFNFITNVGFTVTTQTSDPDPQTGMHDTMTKSFLDLAPRNVKAGLTLAQGGFITPLQPTPPGLPMS